MLVHSFMTVLAAVQPLRPSRETAAYFALMAASPAHPSRIMQLVRRYVKFRFNLEIEP